MNNELLAESIEHLQTLLDILRFGVSQFNAAELYYGHGTDNAWDEAVQIALSCLHINEHHSAKMLNAQILPSERKAILELFQRRINERIPAAYLTHKAIFAGLPFYVDERVLVPRSPIAELIEQGFAPWLTENKVQNVLDLCTGSGCIAIACCHAFPDARVVGIDLSDDALAVAQINREQHELTAQLTLLKSDLFAELGDQRFDLIVSNPPYVDAHDLSTMPAEYQREPELGLAAGEDGLNIVKRILKNARKHLTEEGILVVEVGNSAEALVRQFPQLPFIWLEFERGGDGVFLLHAEHLPADEDLA